MGEAKTRSSQNEGGWQGSHWCPQPQEQEETVPAQVTPWCSASRLQYGRYIRSALRQEKGLSAIADLLTHDSERVVKAASGALRNLAVDLRNKELIGEDCSREDIMLSVSTWVKLILAAEEVCGHGISPASVYCLSPRVPCAELH